MFQFPDFLYRLTPRDEQITSIEIVNKFKFLADALTVLDDPTFYTIDNSRVLVITNLTAQLYGDGTNIGKYFIVQNVDVDENIMSEICTIQTPLNERIAAETQAFNWQGNVICPPSTFIKVIAQFDGDDMATNNASISMQAVALPRGTFAV